MSKYQPLAEHLEGLRAKSCTVTFERLERIIGSKLPRSAWEYRPWWSNDQYHVQGRAWMEAGWRVVSVNQDRGRVRFERV